MDRRYFLQSTVAAGLLSAFPASLNGMARFAEPGKLEKRKLGRTGEALSIIGFGGIVVRDATPQEASERVRQAIEAGVNYFDVAPSYGNAEDMLGPALEPYRKNVFLACKTTQRTAKESLTELENSLRKMRTDHFDLYQFHSVTTLKDVQTILGPDGALETFQKARQQGKIRFIGFSAHSIEAALEIMGKFSFDTVLYPVNFATWNAGNFGPHVLQLAQEKGMGILALKAMAKQPWPKDVAKEQREKYRKCWYEPMADRADAEMGLRFTLSHPVTAAIPPGDENLFKMALDLAKGFKPLSDAEMNLIKERGMKTDPLFRYPSARPV
jgi:predicted aldo/keto reductase-like oxidoreductase